MLTASLDVSICSSNFACSAEYFDLSAYTLVVLSHLSESRALISAVNKSGCTIDSGPDDPAVAHRLFDINSAETKAITFCRIHTCVLRSLQIARRMKSRG